MQNGPIRDSVTGNVKVHAAATFDLIAQANARVEWVALLPLGQSLSVEQNQTLIQLVQDDLDLRMDRLMLDREQFNERKELGSPTEILLSIKEKELLSMRELAKIEKVSSHSFDLIDNEVEALENSGEVGKAGKYSFPRKL